MLIKIITQLHDFYNVIIVIIFFNPVTTPIHNVTWRRVDTRTLEFTCELTCRTPAITGCLISLRDTSNGRNTLSSFSTILSGTDEDISSRFVTVLVNNVEPTAEYSFTAAPQAIVDRAVVTLEVIRGIIPAAIQGMYILYAHVYINKISECTICWHVKISERMQVYCQYTYLLL